MVVGRNLTGYEELLLPNGIARLCDSQYCNAIRNCIPFQLIDTLVSLDSIVLSAT